MFSYVFFLFFVFEVFGGHISFFGATGSPVLDFWWHLLWVSKPEWVLPYLLFLRRRMKCTLPMIHLWCYICQPLGTQSVTSPHREYLAQIRMGNHPDRRQTRYHCASDPAVLSYVILVKGKVLKRKRLTPNGPWIPLRSNLQHFCNTMVFYTET